MPDINERLITIDDHRFYAYNHPRPTIAVDCVIFGIAHGKLKVLLITRKNNPFKSCYALPGGMLEKGETAVDAAARELSEETNLIIDSGLMRLVGIYDDPHRDPRGRVISIAYTAPIGEINTDIKAGDDASTAEWVGVQQLRLLELAFDHKEIIHDAVKCLDKKLLARLALDRAIIL